jgi:serine/threonine protein kinase
MMKTATAAPPQFRDYEIERVIARGGMATVYLATDQKQNRKVALKAIHPHIAEDPEFLQRFLHEVRIHRELKHPNILELFDFGDSADGPFIAMEYVDGATLKSFLEQLTKLPCEIALFVAEEVLCGLAFAHQKGIVHRDVKPANVLITRRGGIKVADFGISRTEEMTRLTQTGNVIGTPAYMSPEQALAAPVDARSDIFSVGILLYEMLSGRNPFGTDNPVTTIRRVIDAYPEDLFRLDPTIPTEVEELVGRMLAKDPSRRFPTAMDALQAVTSCIQLPGGVDARDAFRRFLHGPSRYLEERRQTVSRAHLQKGKSLLESKAAAPEVALWEIFQAHKADAGSLEASELYQTIASNAGARLTIQMENAKILELEEKLRSDPQNVQLLLQLAKLCKLERDFISMMRFFLKLKRLKISDTYLEGQIDSLVAPPEQGPGSTGVRPTSRSRAAELPAAPRKKAIHPASKWLLVGLPALFLLGGYLAIRSIWKEASVSRLRPRQVRSVGLNDLQVKARGDAGAVVARARKVVETGDNSAAMEILDAWTRNPVNTAHPDLPRVLLELAALNDKVGRSEKALAIYSQLIDQNAPERFEARAARGDLLFRLDPDGKAEADFRVLRDSGDPTWVPVAHFYLGKILQRQNNLGLALDHFETLAQRFPQHDLANEGCLLAARLRLAAGSLSEAAALAQQAQEHSKVGGDVHRQASELLTQIQGKQVEGAGSEAADRPQSAPANQ